MYYLFMNLVKKQGLVYIKCVIHIMAHMVV